MSRPVALVVLDPSGLSLVPRLRRALPHAALHDDPGRCAELFAASTAIIGVGGADTLIRLLAPVLQDHCDPAPVIAVAAHGGAVVPLLGGREASDLATRIADALGVTPAITDTEPPVTPTPRQGSLTIIGLGPGNAAWLLPAASAAIALATDLVGYGPYLAQLPPLHPDQRQHASDNRVELSRACHALDLAAIGGNVVLVSSGDPGIFAMSAAVFEALDPTAQPAPRPDWAAVTIQIVPGISAMQAAAALTGAPLGHDFCVISLSDIRKPWDVVARRLDAAAAADLVVALYNPISRHRPWQLGAALACLGVHRSASTPVVIGRDLGRPDERVRITELGRVDPAEIDMRTVLLVGSSTTRRIVRDDGTEWVYTPRSYPPGSYPPGPHPEERP